jgi:hypothetical protein
MTEIDQKKTLKRAMELNKKLGDIMNREFARCKNEPEIHLRAFAIAAIANLIADLIATNKDYDLMRVISSSVEMILQDHKSDIDKCTKTEEVKQ